MSSSRSLCFVCERPTADGAVQALHVDKEKLQTWSSSVNKHKLSKEIGDADLICFFCIWHAELDLVKNYSKFSAAAWWPFNLDYLDGTSKELRSNFIKGKAKQCWVQLGTIELPEESADPPKQARACRQCFYCGEQRATLSRHMQRWHKDAIRCDFTNCATYFHSVEEKEKHSERVHLKMEPKNEKNRKFQCTVCQKGLTRRYSLTRHILLVHPEFNRSLHSHISHKHRKKTAKNEESDRMFASKQFVKKPHALWECKLCGSAVLVQSRPYHLIETKCNRCNFQVQLCGFVQSTLESVQRESFVTRSVS